MVLAITANSLAIPAERTTSAPRPLQPAVRIERLTVRYGAICAVDDVSLDIRQGEILFLLGPSGSGKSSLLRLIAGIERPGSGRVLLNGAEVAGPRCFVQPEDRRIGMVFQDGSLFPHLTVAANVAFGIRHLPARERDARVATLLAQLGVERYARQYPHTLSGGERQRVALARALAPQPRVLLMDEPFSSLDERLRDRVRDETIALLRETGTTTVIVSHDPQEALSAADRIALMRGGRLLQCGSVHDLYSRPASAFVARFFGEVNEIPAVCDRGRVDTCLGCFAAPEMPDRTPVRVCIRPQHVRLADRPTGLAARVVGTGFMGETERVVVALERCGTRVSLRVFGRAAAAPGDTVFLDLDSSHVVVAPDEQH
jgi:iron(III) transport system ATP-binding protein